MLGWIGLRCFWFCLVVVFLVWYLILVLCIVLGICCVWFGEWRFFSNFSFWLGWLLFSNCLRIVESLCLLWCVDLLFVIVVLWLVWLEILRCLKLLLFCWFVMSCSCVFLIDRLGRYRLVYKVWFLVWRKRLSLWWSCGW